MKTYRAFCGLLLEPTLFLTISYSLIFIKRDLKTILGETLFLTKNSSLIFITRDSEAQLFSRCFSATLFVSRIHPPSPGSNPFEALIHPDFLELIHFSGSQAQRLLPHRDVRDTTIYTCTTSHSGQVLCYQVRV